MKRCRRSLGHSGIGLTSECACATNFEGLMPPKIQLGWAAIYRFLTVLQQKKRLHDMSP